VQTQRLLEWLPSHYDEVASELNIGKDSRSVPWAVQRCRAATDESHMWKASLSVRAIQQVEPGPRGDAALTEALEKWLS
jgi:hypothetical protein